MRTRIYLVSASSAVALAIPCTAQNLRSVPSEAGTTDPAAAPAAEEINTSADIVVTATR